MTEQMPPSSPGTAIVPFYKEKKRLPTHAAVKLPFSLRLRAAVLLLIGGQVVLPIQYGPVPIGYRPDSAGER